MPEDASLVVPVNFDPHIAATKVTFDPDIAADAEWNIGQKTMVQMYRDFRRGAGKLFSDEIDAEINVFDDLKKVVHLLEQEDAKTLPIIFCAYVDDVLLEMYKHEIPDDVPGRKNALFGVYGPLSDLSGRLKLAYCFQLISSDLVGEIYIIRKVRNDLSHNWDMSILANYFSSAPVTRMIYVEKL